MSMTTSSNDDALLDALGDLAQEQDAAGDRWRALTDGAVDDSALEALREEDPLAFEAHRPISAAREDAIAATLLGHMVEAKPEPPAAPVISLDAARRRRRGWVAAAGTLLAAAAAVLLFMRPGVVPTPGASLPAYELTLLGSQKAVRSDPGEPAGVVKLHPTSTLDLQLRPATQVDTPVALRAWLDRAGKLSAWTPPSKAGAGGTFRVQGRVDDLLAGVAPGVIDLILVVGPAETLTALGDTPGADWLANPPDGVRVVRRQVEVLPR